MSVRFALLIALIALLCRGVPAHAADMFGRAKSPPAATRQAPAAEIFSRSWMPAPVRLAIGEAVAVQSRLNGELRGQMQLARQGESWRPALAIMLISFLYGVVHAVGPGHGKVVVGSYFLSRRARVLHGLMMSSTAALVQAVSAVALVSLLAAFLEVGSSRILAHAATLETVSYGAITLLGLWMVWGIVSGRGCSHQADEPGAHGPACGHDHRHGESHDVLPTIRTDLAKVLATGAAIGLRPCSGAILVLLFTLANQIYPIGIAAAFAMGLGVAITVSVVSLATLGFTAPWPRSAGIGALWPSGCVRRRPWAGPWSSPCSGRSNCSASSPAPSRRWPDRKLHLQSVGRSSLRWRSVMG